MGMIMAEPATNTSTEASNVSDEMSLVSRARRGEMDAYDELVRRYQEIGRRRVGKECLRLCRSRWSPYH